MPKGKQLALTPEMSLNNQIDALSSIEASVRSVRRKVAGLLLPRGLDSDLMDACSQIIRRCDESKQAVNAELVALTKGESNGQAEPVSGAADPLNTA